MATAESAVSKQQISSREEIIQTFVLQLNKNVFQQKH
jgi:hypothetical protein